MRRLAMVGFVVLLCGPALADDARRLRIEAAGLVHAAEKAVSARERQELLEEAHGKLIEVRRRYPSEAARFELYLGGQRTILSPESLREMIIAALDVGGLREVLGRALSPEAVNEDGWTDLHYAAALDLPELVRALLDSGADIAAKLKSDENDPSARLKQSLGALDLPSDFRRYGYTALHMAALNNARNAALALLSRGADVNAKSEDGMTALHMAASKNSSETAVALLARGAADVNAKSSMRSPRMA